MHSIELMRRLAAGMALLAATAATAVANDDPQEEIRALKERMQQLEQRLERYESRPSDLREAIDSYFAETGALDAAVEARHAAHLEEAGGGLGFSVSGLLWLSHGIPSSGTGFDGARSRSDVDYLDLYLEAEAEPYGMRVWAGVSDEPHYTDASPFGNRWLQEALVYATIPMFEGEHEVTVEAGKVFVPFGLEWDHTWYGNVLYYKGLMYDSDWGARAMGEVEVGDGVTFGYAAAWFNRSDDLDGASSNAGFGIEGTALQSPEYSGSPTGNDREQRDQVVLRGTLSAELAEGVTGTLGASYLDGRIRTSAPDGSLRFQRGARVGSFSETDVEVDLQLVWEEADLGFLQLPGIELLTEYVSYDRGPADQEGDAFLAELYVSLWETESDWLRSVAVGYNYSHDDAHSQADSTIHLPFLRVDLNDSIYLLVERVSFRTSDFMWERGVYVHLAFAF